MDNKPHISRAMLRADFLLLLTAAIWGFGFVAQRSGMENVGPFSFNGIRFILGSLSLVPLILIRRKKLISSGKLRHLMQVSLPVGGCLFIAVLFQQFGLIFTTAGNAGFITGLYVVFTPALGIFLGRKTGLPTWVGSVLTLTGLYFLGAAGKSSVNPGDVITVISALFWTAHVLLIDRFVHVDIQRESSVDPVELSAAQFAICGVLMLLGAIFAESHVTAVIEKIDPALLDKGLFEWQPFPALAASLRNGTMRFSPQIVIPILYGGLCSVGIAYTLQVTAQRDAPPAHATIILCFEGCFAALGGVLLLSEKIGIWTLIGFILMLAGMIATQWDVIVRNRKNRYDYKL
jgi:drug/metabolite transporter (DMT)-like permease